MPPERPRRAFRARREAQALVVVRDPRAIAALVAMVVALAIGHYLVLALQAATGRLVEVRPVLDVIAVLGACVAGERYGNVRVLGWTTIGALLGVALARVVPVAELTATFISLAEAALVGGIPLSVLVAQDVRWVGRALVTGMVFGLRYWSEYVALFVVRLVLGGSAAQSLTAAGTDVMVVAAAVLVASGYVLVRVFDRLAPPPAPEEMAQGTDD